MRLIALLPLLLIGGIAAAQDTVPPAAPTATGVADVLAPANTTGTQDAAPTNPAAAPAPQASGTPAAAVAATPAPATGAAATPANQPAPSTDTAATPASQPAPSVDATAAPQTAPATEAAATPENQAAPAANPPTMSTNQPAPSTDAAATPESQAAPAAPPSTAATAPAAGGAGTQAAETGAAQSAPAGQPPEPALAVPALPTAAGDVANVPAATAARPLTIGLLDNAPPFSSAARYGVRVGFDVDLAYGLCARLQRRCRFLPLDRAELTLALRDRRIDAVIASDGRSEYAGAFAGFSEPYLSLAARFVVPRASAADLEAADATAYGAVVGTPHAQYLQTTYKDPSSVALYSSQEEMWIDLALGRLQGALATAVTARLEFLDTPLGNDFRFASGTLANAKVHANQATIAVRKGDGTLLDQLNQALASYMNSSDYAEALNRHLTGGLATRPSAAGRT